MWLAAIFLFFPYQRNVFCFQNTIATKKLKVTFRTPLHIAAKMVVLTCGDITVVADMAFGHIVIKTRRSTIFDALIFLSVNDDM